LDKGDRSLSRRRFLESLGITAAASLFFQSCVKPFHLTVSGKKTKFRNIIFILSDDHRHDFMGFMGRPAFLNTPNMDRLARNGTHLKNAFVTTSLCSPSRASIFTGQYSHRHGVIDNQTDIPDGTIFFPEYLQNAGYETAFFGKWHMGHDTDRPRPGFNKWVSFKGQGVYYNPEINVDGRIERVKGYISDILTDYALNWLINERDPGKPFFLFLSHKAVHAMFKPAERHLGLYDNEKIEYPATMADTEENYQGKPRWVREQRNSWHGVDYMYHGAMDFDTFYRRYCETLLGIDDSIGRVLDCLEENDLNQSTMMMYMGDNGFSFGEHGLIDKRHMYEESIRVPFIASCPGLIEPGTTVHPMVQNIDIAPTLLEWAGAEVPAYMNGMSMLPLFNGKKDPVWRDSIFYEYYWEWNYPQTPTVHGIRTEQYKYMHYHGIWDDDELYDIESDPDEMQNLIHEPEFQDIVKDLNNRVFEWLDKTQGLNIPLRRTRGERNADQKDK